MNVTDMGMGMVNTLGVLFMLLIVFIGLYQQVKFGRFQMSFIITLIIAGIYAGFYLWYKGMYTNSE